MVSGCRLEVGGVLAWYVGSDVLKMVRRGTEWNFQEGTMIGGIKGGTCVQVKGCHCGVPQSEIRIAPLGLRTLPHSN